MKKSKLTCATCGFYEARTFVSGLCTSTNRVAQVLEKKPKVTKSGHSDTPVFTRKTATCNFHADKKDT